MMKIIVVHGNENRGYALSQDSVDRCKETISLYHSIGADRIICSGGFFSLSQKEVGIGLAINSWFLSHGLESADIVVEDTSLTTIHNVEMVSKMMGKDDIVYVVSSDYHSRRVRLIWNLIGKRKIIFVSAKSRITIKKILVEVIGMMIVIFYHFGWKFPELFYRRTREK